MSETGSNTGAAKIENNETILTPRGEREGSARSHDSNAKSSGRGGGERKHERSDRDRSSRNDRDNRSRDRGDSHRERRSGGGGGSSRRDSSRDRNNNSRRSGGDRDSKRRRSRSRSPRERNYDDRDHRDNRDNRDNRDHSRRDNRDSRNRRRSPVYNDRPRDQGRDDRQSSPRLTEEEREMRSVFVIQLSARVGDRELTQFFENNAGPVREARVITDRISRRSKGVGYVEFVELETVGKALALSQTVLLGIPIIVQYTEAEKNRQARDGTAPAQYAPPYQPAGLYVGSLNFALTESDIRQVFQPFGEVEMVNLQKDPATGKSKGYAFVQFKDPKDATQALEKMNNFPLAGREIKVGLVAEKGSAPVPRQGGQGGEQTLEDYNGGNLTSISRIELMQKLSRSDRPAIELPAAPLFRPNIPQAATTNVLLKDAFNPEEETDRDWDIDLRDDIKTEVESKYGKVVEIFVVKQSAGEIYVKFDTVASAASAVTGLNGRWFGGRQLGCSLISDLMLSSSRV